MNNIFIVGRLTREPNVVETETGKKITNITLAVSRSYKNVDGIYETDFIPVILWNDLGSNVVDYCRKGDLLGVKGRLQNNDAGNVEVVADKVTFLSSNPRRDD